MKRQVFISTESWPYNEFPRLCNEMKRISPRRRQWLKMIAANKLTCPETGLKVHEVRLDENHHRNGNITYHYNFYSRCGRMFTVDHRIPKSKGGHPMRLSNLQPMIDEYNWKKGDKMPRP